MSYARKSSGVILLSNLILISCGKHFETEGMFICEHNTAKNNMPLQVVEEIGREEFNALTKIKKCVRSWLSEERKIDQRSWREIIVFFRQKKQNDSAITYYYIEDKERLYDARCVGKVLPGSEDLSNVILRVRLIDNVQQRVDYCNNVTAINNRKKPVLRVVFE